MSRLACILLSVLICSHALAQPAPPPEPPAAGSDGSAARMAPPPDPSPPTTPPSPEMEAAKRHFDQGNALFNDSNYAAALAEFEEAYRGSHVPAVLYNMGLTQKAMFRYSDAIASIQKFIDASPDLAADRRAEAVQLINEMKALLADVTLAVVPDHATISVDGRELGTSPLAGPLALAAGAHKIEVTADGYAPVKKDVIVTAGVALSLKLELREIPKSGKVHIDASVPKSVVSIDGVTKGLTPIDVELLAGGHTLEVKASGYDPDHEELVIAAGQSRELHVALQQSVKPRSWYQKWYVWTPIAVVVVGAAAGLAINFGTHEGPVAGTLSPGAGGIQ